MTRKSILSTGFALGLALILLSATAATAAVVLQAVEGGAELSPAGLEHPPNGPSLVPRIDVPDDLLLAPYFVDTNTGDTTLFAVRNTADITVSVDIEYFGPSFIAGAQLTDTETLAPRETKTVNIRDLTGSLSGSGGIFRGFVRAQSDTPESLTGDFFQVDLIENFATGDRMVAPGDLCDEVEVRFLQGGPIDGGTELTMIVNAPAGSDPMTDPPTATIRVYSEGGGLLSTTNVFSDVNVIVVDVGAVTATAFGVLEIDIPGTGWVNATYSAAGKYSIGLDAACIGTPFGV